MANSATARTSFGCSLKGNVSAKVTPVGITIDTTSSDLTVYTPASTNRCAVAGIIYSETGANTLTIKSGSTTICSSAVVTGGILKGVSDDLIWICNPGESLVISSSANIVKMDLYVVEYKDKNVL